MSSTPKKQPAKKRFNIKKFLLITVSIALILIALFFGKQYYDTYHDRPLAKGLQYVGRDYNNPCFFGQCYGPETEILYYATDIEPKGIVKLFPGWKVKKVNEGTSILWHNKRDASRKRAYTLEKQLNGDIGVYRYLIDKDKVISDSRLLPTNKKYIIQVWRDSYDKLRQ